MNWFYAAAASTALAVLTMWHLGEVRDAREAGRVEVRAEWAAATEEARRITESAMRAAEDDKAALREALAGAQAAARRARGGVERIDRETAAALEAIR